MRRVTCYPLCRNLVFMSSSNLSSIIMRKFISPKFSSMFKKFGKHKSQGSQSNPSLVQQQPSGTLTSNSTASLATQPLANRSATETASLVAYNLATSVAVPTSNPLPSSLETAPTSTGRAVAKDTAVNALKLLLKIASDIPGPGAKPALAGLLTIIERVQVRQRTIWWSWTVI